MAGRTQRASDATPRLAAWLVPPVLPLAADTWLRRGRGQRWLPGNRPVSRPWSLHVTPGAVTEPRGREGPSRRFVFLDAANPAVLAALQAQLLPPRPPRGADVTVLGKEICHSF